MKTVGHFFIKSCLILARMRNASDKHCRENQNTHFVFNNFSFVNHAICEIMWKNTAQQGEGQVTIWCMRIVCWLTKVTHTLTICNTSTFPLYQWLQEHISVLCYTYIACLARQ